MCQICLIIEVQHEHYTANNPNFLMIFLFKFEYYAIICFCVGAENTPIIKSCSFTASATNPFSCNGWQKRGICVVCYVYANFKIHDTTLFL